MQNPLHIVGQSKELISQAIFTSTVLCPESCNKVAQAILEKLVAANLFIVSGNDLEKDRSNQTTS